MKETFLRDSRHVDLATDDGWSAFLRDDAGHPLRRGMPMGTTIREDGETHREAWMRVVRADPCAYCGERATAPAGTVDHIDPKRGPAVAGGVHTWFNFTAACERCNQKKGRETLLLYLARRRGVTVPQDPARRVNPWFYIARRRRQNGQTRPKEYAHGNG